MKNAALLAGAVLAGIAGLSCSPDYQWSEQSGGTTAEFRGLSAAGPDVVWAAGRNGAYGRTVDGGATWTSGTVAGALDLFFIDVHAVDANTAYLLGTHFEGSLAKIYKTIDGGAVWIEQYRDSTPGVFFDGMAFWDAKSGIAFSDPVADGFLIVTTDDGGATWNRVPPASIPPPLPGEAGFAASGTGIAVYGDSSVCFGTGGGHVGRVYRSTDRGRTWSVSETPIAAGSTAGIFGITFWDADNGVAVGGDHTRPHDAIDNVARTRDGGLTWTLAGRAQPAGVRWGVTHVRRASGPTIVATGPSGWGYSSDAGTYLADRRHAGLQYGDRRTGRSHSLAGRHARPYREAWLSWPLSLRATRAQPSQEAPSGGRCGVPPRAYFAATPRATERFLTRRARCPSASF